MSLLNVVILPLLIILFVCHYRGVGQLFILPLSINNMNVLFYVLSMVQMQLF